MRVRRTLPMVAFVSTMSLATLGAWPAASAAQDRGHEVGTQRADYSSSLRFVVNPNQAEVFVDGSYAGRVDDFDGVFQRLHVRPGRHDVVLYLDGYRTAHDSFYVGPNATRTIQLSLPRLGHGERPSARPNDRGVAEWWDPRWNDTSTRFGTLSLGLAPYDSEVWVDGRRWTTNGRNERVAMRLDPGRHYIEVRRAGYRTYTREVTVATGKTITFNVSLRHS